ncbi:MAG: 2-polyprenyl-3-methyl-6-methoxy-1,4-benzoquinone monooxygenase [Alcaligenaceae bacterium]|nr:2-polyprenyl-3-methyl-6-methoxy-1,4-benzoquinone monooxygenase [Alcaligenaceae bacterium]
MNTPQPSKPATSEVLPSGFSRRLSPFDRLLSEVSRAVQVLDGSVQAGRPNPADAAAANETPPAPAESIAQVAAQSAATADLSPAEQKHAAGLMRVNHVGEICAQALYRGQAVLCGDAAIRKVLYKAAAEEVDHLVWCRERLQELKSHPSVLNPLWYLGSFTLGLVAGRAGTRYNLGFMAETERQVEQHLDHHLQELPPQDQRSRHIVEQMRIDEIDHRHTAQNRGAAPLPAPVKGAMRIMSRIMTTTAYRL